MRRLAVPLLGLLLVAACRPAPPVREFRLAGQVVAVRAEAAEITIRHEDIEGFMPGMTMPFRVKDPGLLEDARPGDLVEATLAVGDEDAWLSAIRVTGHEALPEGGGPAAPGLAPGDLVPDAAFVDQEGRGVSLAALRGRPLVLTFVYTRCPLAEFCPTVDRRFVELQARIREDEALSGVRLLSITIDPEYDQPDVLAAHAARLGADPSIWSFVTGPLETVDAFGTRFGLHVTRASPEPADLLHNLRTAVVDPDGRLVRVFTGTDWEAPDVVAALGGGTAR